MSFYSNLPAGDVGNSSLYPTIFEIVSSQEIDTLLPASVRYIITNYWIARHPNRLTLLVNNYFEEWFQVLLKGAVEWYHITEYNSTFVDRFYGLQRFNTSNKVLVQKQAKLGSSSKTWPRGLQLTAGQKKVVFLQKIILPYVRNRLDELQSQWVAQVAFREGEEVNHWKQKIFIQIYPLVKKVWFILDLFTKLLFLAGRTGAVSFLDYLFKIEYTRATLPLNKPSAGDSSSVDINRPQRQNLYNLLSKCRKLLANLGNVSAYVGSQLFPAFVFMLRVYQWWTTQDLSAKLQRKLNDIDKDIPRATSKELSELRSGETCPICHNLIQNASVLETGYAACYPCALEYLPKNEGCCPVTGRKLLGCTYDEELSKWKVVTGVRKLLI